MTCSTQIPTLTLEEFQSMLVSLRKRTSLRDLGRLFGASDMAVLYWSRGERNPSRRTLALASLLAAVTDPSRELGTGLPGSPYEPRKRKPRTAPAAAAAAGDDLDPFSLRARRWS